MLVSLVAGGCVPERGNTQHPLIVPLLILQTFAVVSLVHPFSRFHRLRNGYPFLLWKLFQPLVPLPELFSRFLFSFVLKTQVKGTQMVSKVQVRHYLHLRSFFFSSEQREEASRGLCAVLYHRITLWGLPSSSPPVPSFHPAPYSRKHFPPIPHCLKWKGFPLKQ